MPPKKSKTVAQAPAAPAKSAPAAKSTSKKSAPTAAKPTTSKKKADEDSVQPAPKKTTTAKSTPVPAPKKVSATKTASKNTTAAKAAPEEKAVDAPKKRKADEDSDEPAPKKAKTTKAAATAAPRKGKAPPAAKTKTVSKAAPKKPKADSEPVEEESEVEEEEEEEEEEEVAAPVTKKAVAPKKAPAAKKGPTVPASKKVAEPKKAPATKTAAAPKPKKAVPVINEPPTQILDIYVFGEGSAGELGLGSGKGPDGKSVVDVKRPRLNYRLSAKEVGVVQVATGGMHCAALTHDNRILTWGVNDQGALGRETLAEGKMKSVAEDADSDSDDDSDAGAGLNPNEAEPREIDTKDIPENTKFAAIFASDSTTYALTTDGQVYGWGSFRGNDGVLGFREGIKQQNTPMLIPELKNITSMSCGTNHVLALDTKGKVYTWGAGEQNQLARRVVSRTAAGALVPREFGLGRKKIAHIGCGDYHSFAITDKGEVWAWGLNTFGQTGVEKGETGEEELDDTVAKPTLAKNLKGYDIKQIVGGAHHSIACTEKGEVLVFGRIDNHEGGMEVDEMPKENLFIDENGRARYLIKPVVLEDINGVFVATANDTCLAISAEGKAYTWGFSSNYQTGQGTADEVVEATMVDNTAVRDKKLVSGGIGGQFGVLCGEAADVVMTNGI